ncbi:hypothetical protein L2E82_23000 [Cichorium intybus]|uniref:Uncharacterized protein n=1 Tax=Cichorium intybus TaxID=13427 RepID=A0ACB9DZC3_CICIN|nr:hypothetical protein L2E82_23000 [Cichorium intybus]
MAENWWGEGMHSHEPWSYGVPRPFPVTPMVNKKTPHREVDVNPRLFSDIEEGLVGVRDDGAGAGNGWGRSMRRSEDEGTDFDLWADVGLVG